jgi:hypothetical protein
MVCGSPTRKHRMKTVKIGVSATYALGEGQQGRLEFVARVPMGLPTGVSDRARRAVARRLGVSLRQARIAGIETY